MWKNLAFDPPVKCELCESHSPGRSVELHPSFLTIVARLPQRRGLGREEQNPSL